MAFPPACRALCSVLAYMHWSRDHAPRTTNRFVESRLQALLVGGRRGPMHSRAHLPTTTCTLPPVSPSRPRSNRRAHGKRSNVIVFRSLHEQKCPSPYSCRCNMTDPGRGDVVCFVSTASSCNARAHQSHGSHMSVVMKETTLCVACKHSTRQ